MPNESKHVLVTGAAGFIGSHVVDELLEQEENVVGLDNFNDYYDPVLKEKNLKEASLNNRFTLIRGDIRDSAVLDDVFRKYRIQTIIHLAAMVGVRNSVIHPSLYADVNVVGTTRLLNNAAQHKIENFILASSSSVYGKRANVPFKESDPIEKPESPYAATKRGQELIAYSYHSLYNIPVTCLRFFTAYGPRGRPDMAAFKFIDRISKRKPIQQYGNGQSTRDYTFVSDIVQGILAATKKTIEFDIFNLGGGCKTSLKEFIHLIENVVGIEAIIDVLPVQPGDLHDTLADISKARSLLNYNPKVSLSEGIEKTVEWYRDLYAN